MTQLPAEDALYKLLEQRVSPAHLRQRLGIESDHEAQVFGQGLNLFHIENWYSIHSAMRGILKILFLHRRGRRNALDVEICSNVIGVPGLPEAFQGYTILQISDLHLDMNGDIPQALIRALQDLRYDLCVLTGDYRAKTYGGFGEALEAMRQVRSHLQGAVYGVLGNHDSIQMVPGLEALDVCMLLNESVALERDGQAIYLAGIDDPHYYRADNLEKASLQVPHGAVSILLAHSPEIYRHAAHAGFDVMFCGHTHGGQICLPGGLALMCNASCPRAYCAGPWRYRDLAGYTSRGSGVSVIDVRLNCPPEITLHTLQRVVD